MKIVSEDKTNLEACLEDVQRESVVITRQGRPFALVVGVRGMDLEQIELGQSDRFWKLIEKRRTQKRNSRKELEKALESKDKRKVKA